MAKYKILVCPSDMSGVSKFRSIEPHMALEKFYPDLFSIDIDYQPQYDNEEYLKQYSLIHAHRLFGPYDDLVTKENGGKNLKLHMTETTQRLKKIGVPLVMDIDDYHTPSEAHPSYLIIKVDRVNEKVVNNLRLADYITTTNQYFIDEIKKINPHVYAIPNTIDPSDKQYIPQDIDRNGDTRLRIGYLAGSSHQKDLELMNGVVQRLKRDGMVPEKLSFMLAGFDIRGTQHIIENGKITGVKKITAKESVWNVYERIFTDNYSTISPKYKEYLLSYDKNPPTFDISKEPYQRHWTLPITKYATNYNYLDISVAPLLDHMFNRCKSNLKVIEAGFFKKALICSHIGPYVDNDLINVYEKGGKINDKGNILLVDKTQNHSDWYKYIKLLANNPDIVKQMGENLYNTVKDKYSIETVAKLRKDIYLNILEK